MPRFVSQKSKLRPPLSIKEFHEQRKKVLVVRETGGLGDILMHRMMFEDFKKVMPDAHIVFACPTLYHQALYDHPYIDELANSKQVSHLDYVLHYNTTCACTRHEMRMAPYADKNRADIWANHCGVELESHNMHIKMEPEMLEWAKTKLDQEIGVGRPRAVLAPVSAMVSKNLLDWQNKVVIDALREHGTLPFAVHTQPLPYLSDELKVPVMHGMSIREWMAILSVVDYVVSVDSAAFHFAGGIGKPVTGIFAWADGKVYGKWYDFILVQLHRDNGNWDCGPCFHWIHCHKCKQVPKPCLTEISKEMIEEGIDAMFEKWPS